jgi:hypothetical protein
MKIRADIVVHSARQIFAAYATRPLDSRCTQSKAEDP